MVTQSFSLIAEWYLNDISRVNMGVWILKNLFTFSLPELPDPVTPPSITSIWQQFIKAHSNKQNVKIRLPMVVSLLQIPVVQLEDVPLLPLKKETITVCISKRYFFSQAPMQVLWIHLCPALNSLNQKPSPAMHFLGGLCPLLVQRKWKHPK